MTIPDGPVLLIDDEYEVVGSHANDFYAELRNAGRPVSAYAQLPPEAHSQHWDGLALVIVDWNLYAGEARQPGSSTLSAAHRKKMVAFLGDLLRRYFCLVVIVSTDHSDEIEQSLRETAGFPEAAIGPRIVVFNKVDVGGSVLSAISDELAGDPARSVVSTWEREYQSAKNRMFLDLSELATDWPAYIVKAARADSVDPANELVETLYGNLRHRVDPVAFDLSAVDVDGAKDVASIQSVSFGRRVLMGDRLHKSTIMPGDFYQSWRSSDPPDALWMNITPACYTVRGRKGKRDSDIRLHLIMGVPLPIDNEKGRPKSKSEFASDRQGTRSVVVDFMRDGRAYKFDFSSLQTFSIRSVSKHRVGRLLAPFITNVQQRHAAFLTSEGLPRVTHEMYYG